MTKSFRVLSWFLLGSLAALSVVSTSLAGGVEESLDSVHPVVEGSLLIPKEGTNPTGNDEIAAVSDGALDGPGVGLGESLERPEGHEGGEEESGSSGDEKEKRLYFYSQLADKPIIEYELAPGEDVWAHHKPLLEPDPENHRIVEFYAHWCPHCLHIRPQFIDFSRKLREVSKHYNAPITVHAVSCVQFRPVCHSYDVHAYPRIYLVRKDETTHERLLHADLHPYTILTKLGVELDSYFEDETEEERIVPSDGEESKCGPPGENFFLPRRKKDIFNDAYLSFHFAMKNGIFKSPGPLINTTKDVFMDFIELVSATMPPAFKLRNLAAEILNEIENVTKSEEILISIVDKYPPKKKTWSHSCTRGVPTMGYTCGLWELFHIMTVGLVEYNAMLGAEDDFPYFRPADGGNLIRNFIEHFFDCEVCRTHFIAAYDSCAYEGCNRLTPYVGEVAEWIEFPMWLFEFHNGVNVRLMKERAEREGWTPTLQDERDVQWPSRNDCPMCWYDDGKWEPNNVFLFLRLAYWPDDSFTETMQNGLLSSDLAIQQEKNRRWLRVTRLMNGFLVIVALAGAYLYNKRRRLRLLAKVKKDP